MREIPLSRGFVALVDDGDYESLIAFTWYAVRHGKRMVAMSSVGSDQRLLMHRVILNAPTGIDVDHVRHPSSGARVIDNRRGNLRLASRSENICNSRKRSGTVSVFKGVTWKPRLHKWQARVKLLGKQEHLGYFRSEANAALVYDLAAVARFGQFALTNFPVPGSEQSLFGGAR